MAPFHDAMRIDRSLCIPSLFTVVILVIFTGVTFGEPETSQGTLAPAVVSTEAVAVLPFINISRQGNDDWIGAGIAETVVADFGALHDVSIIGPAQVASTLPTSSSGPIATATAMQLGRTLEARWVVTGGFQRVGNQLRITASVVDTTLRMVTGTTRADGTFDELFELQDRIADELFMVVRKYTAAGTVSPAPTKPWRFRIPPGEGQFDEKARGSDDPSLIDRPITDRAAPAPTVSRTIVAPGNDPPAMASPRAAAGLGLAASAGILTGRPSVTAVRTDEPPRIDGTLDDQVWQQAARISRFVQQNPVEGAPPSEETDVYIAYDDNHLYFGMHAHYTDPSTMRANRADRDEGTRGEDYISLYFDPFLDQQRAYVFSLNGYGVQTDSLLTAGGFSGMSSRSGRSSSMGGMSTFAGVYTGDRSWDALFDSAGTLVADGWTTEMAIPFKSLRYPAAGDNPHRWGFQIVRRIRSNDETAVWSPMSRDVSGVLTQMGLLEGMSGLSTSRNLEFLPTMTAVQVGSLDMASGDFPETAQPEGGLNLKYGLTSNLTLDFTYNPDFSQIESDQPQIEVNQRFPLFFSELRPFFLEGQEIFRFTGPVNFVHTRTIVDPRYGGKVTGKVGNTTVGLLFSNDEAPGNVDDRTDPGYGQTANVLIGRLRYDLYAESHLGLIITDRQFLNGYSRLGGADGNFRLTDTTSFGFRAVTTQNRNRDLLGTTGSMFDVDLRSQGRNLTYAIQGYSIAPEFNTEVGFVRRRDIRAGMGNLGYRWWPENWLINWGPTVSYTKNWSFEDILQDEMTSAGVNFSFARSMRLNLGVNRDMERYGGLNFDKTNYRFGGSIYTFQTLSFSGYFTYGDQLRYDANPFLGTGMTGSIRSTVRPFSRLQSELSIRTSNLIDPISSSEIFDVKIYRTQSTYQFTDRLLLRNITEYNTFSRKLGANVLFTYRVNSGTVFFVGYDDRYQQGDLILDSENELAHHRHERLFTTDLLRTNRAVFSKISYLFRY